MNLAESLLQAIRELGAKEIFGIPGDFALPLFRVIEESGILRLYTLSHEPGVGFAADAAARFHSKPSVAAVTYGAGAFNLVNAVAAAYAEKSPVIVLSGGPGTADRQTGLLIHHQAKELSSQMQMFREVTCDQAILNDIDDAPAQIARVLANCVRHSRPVYIEVPSDMVDRECEPVSLERMPNSSDPDALDACAAEVLERLQASTSPVIMVGVEIRRYGLEEKVASLCAKLNAPVVTSFMGRGLLAGKKVPFRGTYMGVAGATDVTEMVENSDALVLLGVLLSDTNFGISARKIDLRRSILACDGQVSLGFHTYPNITLADLVARLDQLLSPQQADPPADISYPVGLTRDDEAISPTDIATAINDLFLQMGTMPIAADMGDCLFTTLDIEHTELVAPGYYATMGFGVPAGLGVQAATGRRPLILVGDGAFQMTGWELLNCRRYDWNPIVVVFNNASWEMLRAFQPDSHFNNLDSLNYADIANSLGGRGRRVSTRKQLAEALEEAVADISQFRLIDVVLPRGVMSNTLTRFVGGIQRMRRHAQEPAT